MTKPNCNSINYNLNPFSTLLSSFRPLLWVVFSILFFIVPNFNHPYDILIKTIATIILIINLFRLITAFQYLFHLQQWGLKVDQEGLTIKDKYFDNFILKWQQIDSFQFSPIINSFILRINYSIENRKVGKNSLLKIMKKIQSKPDHSTVILSIRLLDCQYSDLIKFFEKNIPNKNQSGK